MNILKRFKTKSYQNIHILIKLCHFKTILEGTCPALNIHIQNDLTIFHGYNIIMFILRNEKC